MRNFFNIVIILLIYLALSNCTRDKAPITGYNNETGLNYGFEISFLADKTVVKKNESLELSLTIRNTSHKDIELFFGSSQLYEISAKSTPEQDAKNIVWNWSHDKDFAQAIIYYTFKAGKSRTFTTIWDCRDNEGKRLTGIYYLTGEFAVNQGSMSKTITIKIE